MTDKTPPAGWVVQVTTPGLPSLARSPSGRLSAILGAPSFKYFNVAIAAAGKAVEATTDYLADAQARDTCVVRSLSVKEMAALGLSPGDVAPA